MNQISMPDIWMGGDTDNTSHLMINDMSDRDEAESTSWIGTLSGLTIE